MNLKIEQKKALFFICFICLILVLGTTALFALYGSHKAKETSISIKASLYDSDLSENEFSVMMLKKSDRKREASFISPDDVQAASRTNKDVVGWIMVPDTNINYPIVKGRDNDFYLHHDIHGNESVYGTIFMDYRNTMDNYDANTSLYGHHMKDGSMFRDLILYKDKSFFDSHRYIYTRSLNKEETWEVFSAYVTDTNFYFIQNKFDSSKEFQGFIDKLIYKSKFKTDIRVTDEDKILTLCTCTYEFNDARFVVHARKVN